ncbi:hypothetical protein MHYP_G00123590 [Metynnis hypsauchen]
MTLKICPHYNKGSGEHGSCKYETSCNKLHLCQHHLQDGCKFGVDCKRAHSFDAAAKKILNDRGFSQGNISNFNIIYKNKLLISSYKEKPAVLPPREKTATPSTGKQCSIQQSNNSVSEANRYEICLFNILQGCSFKEKCVRVHHDLPYKWEILDRNGVTWKPLPNEEHIERAYCNPTNDMRQKEQMRDGSGRKDVDERYLFHGTDQSLIETISKENFDWRISGIHGRSYGKGSYFARDAKYSNTYAKSKTGIKMMFAALVLVGEFTKGNSKYLRPPQRKDTQSFYDSCVDNEANPAIFVIFEKYQIYPEYIIEYS